VERHKVPAVLLRQTRAIRCESAPENNNNVTDLHAYQIREMELYVLSEKVLHNSHVSISNIECSMSGALPSQSLDKPRPIGVVRTIKCRNLDVPKEIPEAHAFAVGKQAGGESLWLPTFTKEVEAEGYEVSRVVHSSCRNVDVD